MEFQHKEKVLPKALRWISVSESEFYFQGVTYVFTKQQYHTH